MMPLSFADKSEEYIIKRVSGKPDIKKHLEDLGFVAGGIVSVVSENNGDLIVVVKGTRVAINREMAQKIYI